MNIGKKSAVAGLLSVAMLGGGVAVASSGITFKPKGDNVQLKCKGGMDSHSQIFQAGMLIFEGDPPVTVDIDVDYGDIFDDGGTPLDPEDDVLAGFRVEAVSLGTHAGTHIDVPKHFIEDGRSITQMEADEFVWPVYVVDVRGITNPEATLTIEDIKAYERANGKIERGSLVVIQTGLEASYESGSNFFVNPGFSGAAVEWMFDERHIAGTGSDAYGPDSSADEDFSATFTTLDKDGVAVVVLNNLDALSIRGDLLIAPPVKLLNGTGFSVNPISCQGSKSAPRTPMNFEFPSDTGAE